MVMHLPGPARSTCSHGTAARRFHFPAARSPGLQAARTPVGSQLPVRPETPNDTKDAWHDGDDALAGRRRRRRILGRRRRISVLLTIDDDRKPSTEQVLPLGSAAEN